MSLDQAGGSPSEFAAEFPTQTSGQFASEFPAEGETMTSAPEPAASDQGQGEFTQGDFTQGEFTHAPDAYPANTDQGELMGMQNNDFASAGDFASSGDLGQSDQPVMGDMMGGQQGDMMGGQMSGDMNDFTSSGDANQMQSKDFTGEAHAPQEQQQDDFFTEAPQTQQTPPPAHQSHQIDDSAMRAWKANQQSAYAEKRIAEERELKHIKEEAQAERELLYSQREKQIANAKQTNREREVVMEASKGEGWEAVLNLISDENLVKDKNTDLSRFKQMLIKLKHQKPITSA